jgi:hypothetical protein
MVLFCDKPGSLPEFSVQGLPAFLGSGLAVFPSRIARSMNEAIDELRPESRAEMRGLKSCKLEKPRLLVLRHKRMCNRRTRVPPCSSDGGLSRDYRVGFPASYNYKIIYQLKLTASRNISIKARGSSTISFLDCCTRETANRTQ